MTSFNLGTKSFSKGYESSQYIANHFVYSDGKLLTRIRRIEAILGILSGQISNLYSNVDTLHTSTTTNASNISANRTSISTNSSNISTNSSRISQLAASAASVLDNSIPAFDPDANIQTVAMFSRNRIATYNEFSGGETMDDSQKLDYIIQTVDALTIATNEILQSILISAENMNEMNGSISSMNETFKTMSKIINDVNNSVINLSNKIDGGNGEDPGGDEPIIPEEPIVPEEPELLTISTKNNIIKTRAGKIINYFVNISGLKSTSIKVYVNGNYSHSMGNILNNSEVAVFSEIIYQEMDGHLVDIMIEDDNGTFSNTIQFIVDIISVFETVPLTLTTSRRNIFCAQHDTAEFKVTIDGALDEYCNLYVNGVYAGFIQGIVNGKEFVIYKEKVTETKDVILQVEYPEGNRSNELFFNIIVDQYIDPEEEDRFFIHSTETMLSARVGDTVQYIASIKGLNSDIINVYINGSYYKTHRISSSTNLESFILYEENVSENKISYIYIEDDSGNISNVLTYELTLINSSATSDLSGVDRTLTINWDDLERYPYMYDHIVCKANISGLTSDWCDVYINGLFNRRLSNLTDFDAVILHEFIAEEDCELNIQIEGPEGWKSNTLKYCIHIKEEIEEPEVDKENVLTPPDDTCVEYTKLIGGNRSTWTKGNQELISDISKLNINALTLSVRMLIEEPESVKVTIDQEDLAIVKDFLLSMRSQCLLNKIQLILEPCPCINKGEVNEREFNPLDQKIFLVNWRNEIVKLLNELKDYSFWGIYVNTNMDILYDNTLLWQEIYDHIKEGRPESKIMIKTNWWESDEDGDMMGLNTKCTHDYFRIWDVIAISAYFPLASKASSASYNEIFTWINHGTQHHDQEIKNDIRTLATTINKPIMFGELGIPALDNAVTKPSDLNCGGIEDETTQTNWYKAWHDSFINEDWFLGWSFYHMADLYDSPYDPTDKSAGLYIASLDIINRYKK